MKKCILTTVFIGLTLTLLVAQTKPKAKKEESPPTQKEMEAMMKEAQLEMDNLDPEARAMMDSLGIQMPSFNSIPQVTDAQLKEAYENESRIVPKKDPGRIASISPTLLTNSALPSYLSGAHNKVLSRLKTASKTKGEEIYKLTKAQYNSADATGNTAAGLWMMGKTQLALYVAGKACIDNPTDANNLNNYAAMLSMSGGEQLSIPLLHYVNKRFPGNSTVLNNIGQAWFGLGDIDKANIYLDSTIRIYAYHSQANLTKSFIEESKDHKGAAIEAVKRSIRKSHSLEKQNRLEKLGYELAGDDLNWDHPMPADALGLEKFHWPEYPKNVNESAVMEKEWDVFKKTCDQEIESLKTQQKKLEEAMVVISQKRTKQLLQAGQKGLWVDPLPPFAPKAFIKLKYLIDGNDGHLVATYQKKGETVVKAYLQAGEFDERLSTQLEVLKKKYEDDFGEGKSNPFAAACDDENSAKNVFLNSANGGLLQASADYLNFLRRKLNDETYYNQYTMWPEVFEVAKINAKITWLGSIRGQKVMFKDKSSWCQPVPGVPEKSFKLSEFDDVSCAYHSTFTHPVGTIKIDCSRMTTELDLKFLKLGLKQDMDKDTFADQFMTCSVEVGAGVAYGHENPGPIKAEIAVGGALGLEFDRNGLRDVIVKGAASVSVGTNVISDGSKAADMIVGTETKDGSAGDVGVIKDLQIEVGVKGQISLISGVSSIEGTGVLEGAVFK